MPILIFLTLLNTVLIYNNKYIEYSCILTIIILGLLIIFRDEMRIGATIGIMLVIMIGEMVTFMRVRMISRFRRF
jgi:hypothetical protein